MYFGYLVAWFGIVVLGLVNATIRQIAYARYVGELAAHQISTLMFAVLVGLYAWALSGFLKPSSPGEAIGVGIMWMVLTVAFEFALGRLVVGDPWGKLLGDYNLLEGRVWGLFILWVGLAPYVFYRMKA
ncbi:MAG TPA: hypothetical protein VFY59_00805 [Rubrobacter sp.]|nr:hypothetical protein [Rubrobacter sp.]